MTRSLRILQIEDNDDDAALLLHEVRRAGFDPVSRRVDTLPELRQALEETWDVILCDFRMPKLNALMALDEVRSQQVDTPFIIVSGTVGEDHAVAALRSGAQDFILKENLSRLIPAIERELRDSETRIKRALAERTLRATEASFRAAFELIPEGILICRDGQIVHANRSAVAMLGGGPHVDYVGRAFEKLFVIADQECVRDRLRETERTDAPTTLGELTMIRPSGHPLAVEVTATSILFDATPAVLAVVRDISARRELIARTMHMDRMLAVGTLAAGVGHEINNPLASVMANLEFVSGQVERTRNELEKLARQESSVTERVAELSEIGGVLSDISEGVGRIREIARDLKTFARNDEEKRPVDLRAVADSALRMAAPEVRHRARIARAYDSVPPVWASESRISQVLLNLIINSAHAIEEGAYDSNEISVRIRSEGKSVIVEVADTGCGIAPEDLQRLFTPFFTTKPIGTGTGLGLSISRRIVRSFGGEIVVSSKPGRGTTMRVVLPAAERTSRPPGTPSQSPPRSARILFIDDERLVGAAFQRAFSREHEVVVVESASEALARLNAGEQFDAIFCDINMTGVSGLKFHDEIERTLPHLIPRLVMVTAGTQLRDARGFESLKAPVLEKPLGPEQVRSVLGEILAHGQSPGSRTA